MKKRNEQWLYAVTLDDIAIAVHHPTALALFRRWKDAVQFKRELKPHVSCTLRVRRVWVTIEFETTKGTK